MFVCLHTKTEIAHANELTDEEMIRDWPLYELEAMNRGFPWVAYKGEAPYTFPVEVPDET